MLTSVNRITRICLRELDLFGLMVTRWRLIRTSNAYLFRDRLPCQKPQEPHRDDLLEETLQIAETEIEIHVIKGVDFNTDKHAVQWDRWEKDNNSVF